MFHLHSFTHKHIHTYILTQTHTHIDTHSHTQTLNFSHLHTHTPKNNTLNQIHKKKNTQTHPGHHVMSHTTASIIFNFWFYSSVATAQIRHTFITVIMFELPKPVFCKVVSLLKI